MSASGPRVVAVFGMSYQPQQGRYLRVANQLGALARAGYDVSLLCWDRECRHPVQEARDGVNIVRFHIPALVAAGPRRNAPNVLKFNRAVYGYLMAQPVDIVHCYNLDAAVAAYAAVRRRRLKAVLDLCEPEYYALWKGRYRWLLAGVNALERHIARRFDHVFVHNRFQVRKFTRLGVAHTQVGSYPNRAMIPHAPRPTDPTRFVIGRLGTIYENNGIEELIAAYRLLLTREAQPGGPHYHLYLAGRVFESYRATFDSLVAPLTDRVTVEGAFDAADMPALYRRLDVSLVLARRTRWFRNITPTKLFDSMANGVPVVASDIGDVRDVVAEGDWGRVVNEEDAADIADGVADIAATPGLREAMARRALRLAHDHYTWEVVEPVFLQRYAAFVLPPP